MDLPQSERTQVALLLILTAATGLVDAFSYLRLGHVFVANMTGNVVFLGLSLDSDSGLSAVASIVAIGGFLAGALLGGRFVKHLGRDPRRWLVSVFAVQAVLLAVMAIVVGRSTLSDRGALALITTVVLAGALGLQNATVRRLAARDLTTTVLTMTLTGLAADSILAGGAGQKPQRRLASVAAMLLGAAAGALLLRVTVAGVLVVAAVLVALVAVGFARSPTD